MGESLAKLLARRLLPCKQRLKRLRFSITPQERGSRLGHHLEVMERLPVTARWAVMIAASTSART
jgi:hypothetical protein